MIEQDQLQGMSFEQIMGLKAQIDAAAAEKQTAARTDAMATILRLSQLHGFSVGDIQKAIQPHGTKAKATGTKTKKPTVTPVAAKYRDPVSGATWSGRGVPPLWIRDVPDRDVFLIQSNPVPHASAPAAASVAPLSEAQAAQHDTNEGRTLAETPAVTPALGGITTVFEEDDNGDDPTTPLAPSSIFTQAQTVPAE